MITNSIYLLLYCIQTLRFHPIKFHAGKNGLQSSIFKYQRICFYGFFFKTDEYERADSISFMVLLERKNQLFHIHRSCKIFPCKKITGLSVVGFNWKLTKLYLNFIFFFKKRPSDSVLRIATFYSWLWNVTVMEYSSVHFY